MDKLVLVKIKDENDYAVVPEEKKFTYKMENALCICEYFCKKWGRVINYEDEWSHKMGYDTFSGTYLDFMEFYHWVSQRISQDSDDLVELHKWMTSMLYSNDLRNYFIYYIGNSPLLMNRLTEMLLKNYHNAKYNKLEVPLYSKRMLFEKVLHGELHYNQMEVEWKKNIPDSTITQEELEEQYWDYILKLFFGSINKEYIPFKDGENDD